MRKTIRQQSMASVLSVRRLETGQCLVSYVEAATYALLRRRILSTIVICSIVWLASVWVAAALAQAQESPSNKSGITVTQRAQPSIASAEGSHLVVSMVDRREVEPSAPSNSATQLTNPHAADPGSAAKVLLPSNPPGAELASLAALASAPSSSLLNGVQGAAGRTDTGSHASGNKTFVYQLGAINFVINGLPNSFSVSSAVNGAAGAR